MNCATSSTNGGIIEVLSTFVKKSSNEEILSKKKALIWSAKPESFSTSTEAIMANTREKSTLSCANNSAREHINALTSPSMPEPSKALS
jgi:hypothetical protein